MAVEWIPLIGKGILESIYMTFWGSICSGLIGLILGVLLAMTYRDGLSPNRFIYFVIGTLVNVIRSIPFIILLIFVGPLTRTLVGTTLGPKGVLVPLVICAAPYVARVVETALFEVPQEIKEAARSMGAGVLTTMFRVVIPEAMPSLLSGGVITITLILGYSAMAGIVGGGGLGDLAIRYGYYRYESQVMMVVVLLLIIFVQVIQLCGFKVVKKIDKRKTGGN
ncbi:MAG: ABC transporter permease [Lachnospiraceae bacterium]|nr:ABC transporter permease [Lachnospiraceae bacterium]